MPNITNANVISDSGQIVDGIIVNADLNAAAGIVLTKLAALTTDNFIIGVANVPTQRTAAQARTSLGLVIGTNIQAWDDDLDDLAALTPTLGNHIEGDGSDWISTPPTTQLTVHIDAAAMQVTTATHQWLAAGGSTVRFPATGETFAFAGVRVPQGATGISSITLHCFGVDVNTMVFDITTYALDTDTPGDDGTIDNTRTATSATAAVGYFSVAAPADSFNALSVDEGDILHIRMARQGDNGSDNSGVVDLFGITVVFS